MNISNFKAKSAQKFGQIPRKYKLFMKLQTIACAVAIATGGFFFSHVINEAVAAKEFDSKHDVGYIYRAILSVLRGSVFEWCANEGKIDLKADVSKTFPFLIDNLRN